MKNSSLKIDMVDLKSQYQNIKSEIDQSIQSVLESARFIKGPVVSAFEENLAKYTGSDYVIGCANGTDALQIALMALDLQEGDEVIVPAFTYVATAEVIALLKLTPVMIDVCPDTFNITKELVEKAITPKTKVIIPVHLFGQCTDMEPIVELANKHALSIIEDNAQAIGAQYKFSNGNKAQAGTIGHIATTSFFPSKNLGCYGDGGAIFTQDKSLAERLKMIANHGQKKRYYHSVIGCNSRLDSIQAAILDVKLNYLDKYSEARNMVADKYDNAFSEIKDLSIPARSEKSTHVFHQYTLKVKNGKRDQLKEHLSNKSIPSGIYYPVPLYKQEAFKKYSSESFILPTTEQLCTEVISLPIHTEMKVEVQDFIIQEVKQFFN
jgi:dTDP-4-amino-4,6-dideoxygalactose transaminase